MIRRFMINISVGIVLVVLSLGVISFSSPGSALAAAPRPCSNNDGILDARYIGLPTFGCGGNTSIIETLVKLAFGALAMLSLLFIVIGGLKYTLSGGDANAIASAKKTITYAVLGLVLGISVFVITSFIFGVLT